MKFGTNQAGKKINHERVNSACGKIGRFFFWHACLTCASTVCMQQTFLGSKIEGSGVLGKAMISSGPRKCGCEKKKKRETVAWMAGSLSQLSFHLEFRYTTERRLDCL